MQFTSALLAVLAARITSTSARIVSISTPTTAQVSSSIPVTFNTESYIQNWNDYSVLFGVSRAGTFQAPAMGTVLDNDGVDLVQWGKSNTGGGSFVIDVNLPSELVQPKTQYNLNVAIVFVTGAAENAGLGFFNSTFST